MFVVGDAARLAKVLGDDVVLRELRKPLAIVPQFRNLYENAWETYRRLLPGAPPEGRDPLGADVDQKVLYVSADLPFATAEEVAAFARRADALDCDYALGLVTAESMEDFYPDAREARHPHGVLRDRRRAHAPEQPPPRPAREARQPPLHRGDVRAPLPEAAAARSSASPGGSSRSEGGGFAVLRAYAPHASRGRRSIATASGGSPTGSRRGLPFSRIERVVRAALEARTSASS